ncbi:ABC-type transport auxiliary lipoprotein family protein [Serpens gallinarum]|uniref:Membrane integrity-associated transporter subunit PqiC n=1 Tax=Serpens gallinarum TaxID=2763075 RepID=A0ABR8TUT8_9PSED|nr:ABC-type transport auxiliary lipoprotein family protein [Serpens gallinarum]MBD7979064.1 membrane integrity-associated transporter subunit PqiC [Serpens gallinarum]
MRLLWTPVLLVLMGLSGCSVLPKAAELDVYNLPAQELQSNKAGHRLNKTLRVNKPVASPLLDSSHIVVVPEAHRVSVYKGVRWSDRAPVLLRDRLLEVLRHRDLLAAVVSDDTQASVDLVLAGELRAFQSEYRDERAVVRIRLQVSLLQGDGKILASRGFEVIERARTEKVRAVVDAFGLAGDQLASKVADWLSVEMQRVR